MRIFPIYESCVLFNTDIKPNQRLTKYICMSVDDVHIVICLLHEIPINVRWFTDTKEYKRFINSIKKVTNIMKNTKKTTCTPSTQVPERTSLFKSIVDNEMLSRKEYDCQLLANRVGLIKKILVNRNLDALNWEFEQKIHDIIEDFANRIDNELYSTKKDA